jgi:AraC-like DNA-binding protein
MKITPSISLIKYRRAGELAEYIRGCVAVGDYGGLHIKGLCMRFASSETVLTREFKRRYGTTVHGFIVREKMSRAKLLLRFSSSGVRGIAVELGYSELSNFSRDFTKATGRPPVVWRNDCMGQPDANLTFINA